MLRDVLRIASICLFGISCLISVSSVTIEATYQGKYCRNESIHLSDSNLLFTFDHDPIKNDSFEMTLDIKLLDHCSHTRCNIVSIGDISLSMTADGSFEISQTYSNHTSFVLSEIPGADTLLPVDHHYHTIFLSFSYINSGLQNVFGVDDVSTYYSSSFTYSAHNATNNRLNASVKHICIQSPLDESHIDIFEGEMKCGDRLEGTLDSPHDVDYYYFELPAQHVVLFDSCSSRFNTSLSLYDMEFIEIAGEQDTICSSSFTNLRMSHAVMYMLSISSKTNNIGRWYLQVMCVVDDLLPYTTANDPAQYVHSTAPYILAGPNVDFVKAERQCEELYNASLATIITDDDMKHAIKVINDTIDKYVLFGAFDTIYVRIGLVNEFESWRWVDGTNCSYTETGECMADKHWKNNEPDEEPNIYRHQWLSQLGGHLSISNLKNNQTTASFVDLYFDSSAVPGNDYPLYLCNGPGSKYKIKPCRGDSCWWLQYVFTDNVMQQDVTGTPRNYYETFKFGIAFWQGQLFIIGINKVHHTTLDDGYSWNRFIYNEYDRPYWSNRQLYAQYESVFYIYGTVYNPLYQFETVVLVEIELEIKQTHYHYLDLQETRRIDTDILYTKCILSDTNTVYFIRKTEIYIYDKETQVMSVVKIEDDILQNIADYTISCVIADDEQFIYIFGPSLRFSPWEPVFAYLKFDMVSQEIISGNYSSLCRSADTSGSVSSIYGRNGKVYFHGCAIEGWKTLMFDTTTHKFDLETVDIQVPVRYDMAYYRSSQLTVMDDNVLLLLHRNKNTFSLYRTITDRISINFKDTKQSSAIWPTDGFNIVYRINDFTNASSDTFDVIFVCQDTTNPIREAIYLNRSNDHCICNQSHYRCDQCYQHFNLSMHLTLDDNYINHLSFSTIYVDDLSLHHSSPLIIPEWIEIELQRCIIAFDIPIRITTSDNPSILIAFNLSSNCFSRINSSFSLDVIAPLLSMRRVLTIDILDNDTMLCAVCDDDISCLNCTESQFNMTHDINDVKEGIFNIYFRSNVLDLQVESNGNNTIRFYRNKHSVFNSKKLLLWTIPSVGCVVLIMILIYWYQYQNAFIVDRAMVLIIGIVKFDDENSTSLLGVVDATKNLTNLWSSEYKYDVYQCNGRTMHSTKDDIINFFDEHTCKLSVEPYYKAVICHVLSHSSSPDSFITSDSESLDLEFIKHQFNEHTKHLPVDMFKMIFHHGCQGHADFSVESKSPPRTRAINVGRLVNNKQNNQTPDANLVVISGNIKGRTLSDSNDFTNCICKSFSSNLKRRIKSDFNNLFVEIRRDLIKRSEGAEICNQNGAIQYSQIRFEKCAKQIANNTVVNPIVNNAYTELASVN
eukprot:913930_1